MSPPSFEFACVADQWQSVDPQQATGSIRIWGTAPRRRLADRIAENAISQLQETGASCGVIPIGTEGRLRWNALPWTLACLAGDPLLDSLIVSRPSPTAILLWDLFAQTGASDVVILDVQEDDAPVDWPALAPADARLARPLAVAIEQLSPAPCVSAIDAQAVRAGLHLLHDGLTSSHQISQTIEGEGRRQAGDYWHAIMHRREPDYGNAKYWFRNVRRHPLFERLPGHAEELLNECPDPAARGWTQKLTAGGWNAYAFVDLCQACARNESSPLGLVARRLQWREMQLLLAQTWRDATGA